VNTVMASFILLRANDRHVSANKNQLVSLL